MLHLLFSSKDDLKKSFWENIPFRRLVISHFFKASILPSSRYSIHPFLPIIVKQNSWCRNELNQFCPPSSIQRQPLSSLLYLSFFYAEKQKGIVFTSNIVFDIILFTKERSFSPPDSMAQVQALSTSPGILNIKQKHQLN